MALDQASTFVNTNQLVLGITNPHFTSTPFECTVYTTVVVTTVDDHNLVKFHRFQDSFYLVNLLHEIDVYR